MRKKAGQTADEGGTAAGAVLAGLLGINFQAWWVVTVLMTLLTRLLMTLM